MVEAEDLAKRFFNPAPIDAVDGISLRAEAGEVLGVLGPNGAGKTTLLRMLATLLVPDRGRATVAGYDVRESPAEVRRSIGYLSTSTGLYGRLTAREMIRYCARLQGVDHARERTDALIERFQLTDFADVACGRLSTGMKQKVSIARAIVHDPPVLILDEPTLGLDVLVAQTLLDFIEESRDAGRCVLLSTHIMGDAERLCDRIAIIHKGKVRAEGTLEELRERSGRYYLHPIFIDVVEGRL